MNTIILSGEINSLPVVNAIEAKNNGMNFEMMELSGQEPAFAIEVYITPGPLAEHTAMLVAKGMQIIVQGQLYGGLSSDQRLMIEATEILRI